MHGVDVCMEWLDVSDGRQVIRIKNTKSAIKKWLGNIPSASKVAMEATGVHSTLLADLASSSGHQAYVINPQLIRQYQKCQGIQQKSDSGDALLIWRYLDREGDTLKQYVPPTDMQRQLQAILSRRSLASKSLTQFRHNQRASKAKSAQALSNQPVIEVLEKQIAALDKELARLQKEIKDAGFDRLMKVPGVGIVTASTLWLVFSRYAFEKADAAVNFAGMDFRFEDSGQKIGQRSMSKRGNAQLRRVLYCAAMSGAKSANWKGVYQRYLERSFKPIQALCILARKILRTAWAVYFKEVKFDSKRINNAIA